MRMNGAMMSLSSVAITLAFGCDSRRTAGAENPAGSLTSPTPPASYETASSTGPTTGFDCPTGSARCGSSDYCCPDGAACFANTGGKYCAGGGFCCFGCPAGLSSCGGGCCSSGTVCTLNDGSSPACTTDLCCVAESAPECPSDVAAKCPSGTTCLANNTPAPCGDFACFTAFKASVGCPGQTFCPNGIDWCPEGQACISLPEGGVCEGSSSGNYCCKTFARIGQSCDGGVPCGPGGACVSTPPGCAWVKDPDAAMICYGPCGEWTDCGGFCCPPETPLCAADCLCNAI